MYEYYKYYLLLRLLRKNKMLWKYTIKKNFVILLLCAFSKILHPASLRARYASAR